MGVPACLLSPEPFRTYLAGQDDARTFGWSPMTCALACFLNEAGGWNAACISQLGLTQAGDDGCYDTPNWARRFMQLYDRRRCPVTEVRLCRDFLTAALE